MSDTSAAPAHDDSPPSPPQGTSQRRREKLKRSKDGCFSCRSRKKRCDFVRPVCASCERLGLACEWPIMGRDEKGRMVVVNRPPKMAKPNPTEGSGAVQASNEAKQGSQPSGSHTGQGQWPARSTSPPRPQKQPSTATGNTSTTAAAFAVGQGRPIAGMRMEDWALSLGHLGLVTHPPPAADSPLAGGDSDQQQPSRTVAQETTDLFEFLLPQYHRSVQAAAHGQPPGPSNAASLQSPAMSARPAPDAEAFLRAASLFPQSSSLPPAGSSHAHQSTSSAFSSINGREQASSAAQAPQLPPPSSGGDHSHQAHPTLAPSPSTQMSPWLEEALNGPSPRTFAQSFPLGGFSPSFAPASQGGAGGGSAHDLSNFSASDWLVSTPRPETGASTSANRTPAVGVSPLAAILSQPSPNTSALANFDVDTFLGNLGGAGGRGAFDQPSSSSSTANPSQQSHHPPSSRRTRRPGDSPENPIVPPLPSSPRKRTADDAGLGFPDDGYGAGNQQGTFDFDFDVDDVPSDDGSGDADVDGEISRASIDEQRKGRLNPLNPSIGPNLSIPLPELPAFIATQAPLLIDYFLRKLAPLVSVLTPDPNSVSALSMAVSAGAALRGGGRDGPRGGVLSGGVERRAGNDLASCFLPMALESDSLLVGIVAWSAMHLSDVGQPWRDIAERMTKDASSRANAAFRDWESSSLIVGVEADREAEKLLGTLILLSEVEICRGSTEDWYSPLMMAQKVLQRLGGSKGLSRLSWNGKWLMQNYVYHELTSSELPLNGPVFDEETYKAVLEGGLNTFMGSTMPIFQILSDIARLSPSLPAVLADTSEDDEPRKRVDSLLGLSSKISLLEARLDACYPTFHASESNASTAPYHYAAFRTYSLTARLYLKQIVLHSNARSIANQTLVAQLLEAIRAVQPTPFESSLLFPIFIAGVDCVTTRDRDAIRALFEGLHSSCRIGNIQTAYLLLQEIWSRNEGGDRWVNWPALARELGWNVSLA